MTEGGLQKGCCNASWIKSIAAWAMFCVLLIVPAPAFGYVTQAWYSASLDTHYRHHGREDLAEQSFSFSIDVGGGVAAPFHFYQLATPTAVISPTAAVVSPTPTDAVSPSPVFPPAQATDTVSAPTPADTRIPTATVPVISTQAVSVTPSLTAVATDTPSPVPTSEQGLAEGTSPAPSGEPMIPPALQTPATQPDISTQEVTTTTAILEGGGREPATYTARVAAPSGSLLDRMTRNKPGIWGKKAFYVILAIVYIVLLVLFFRLVLHLTWHSD